MLSREREGANVFVARPEADPAIFFRVGINSINTRYDLNTCRPGEPVLLIETNVSEGIPVGTRQSLVGCASPITGHFGRRFYPHVYRYFDRVVLAIRSTILVSVVIHIHICTFVSSIRGLVERVHRR